MPLPPLRPDVRGGLSGVILGGLAVLFAGNLTSALKIGAAYQDKGAEGAADEFNRQIQDAYDRGAADARAQGSIAAAACSRPSGSSGPVVEPGGRDPAGHMRGGR